MSRAARTLVAFLALLLVHPVVQPALGHGGNGDGHEDGNAFASETGVLRGPDAKPLTPDARYVEQRNPHAHGSMVVWQERAVGRDWDIMAYNLTTAGPAYPVTLEATNQINPVVRGPWIAWEEHTGASIDILALNLESGEQVRVPDSGQDEVGATLGDRAVYYYIQRNKNTGLLRGYDLVDRRMLYPAGNATVLGPPSAYGSQLAWADGNNLEGKVRVWDRITRETQDVPDLWAIKDGPVLGPWGVAFIADVTRGQRGVYTMLYDLDEGEFTPMRTGWYPHKNVGQCEAGVTWDQFRDLDTVDNLPVVAIWDGFTGKFADFGYHNFDATCSGDWLLYEKVVRAEDPDLPNTARIYGFDMARTRPPSLSFIKLEDGMERGIYRGAVTFRGTLILGDPREPLDGLWAQVDGQDLIPVEARRVSREAYDWRVKIDTTRLFSGQHVLTIIALDSQGTESRRGFHFFTDAPYVTNPAVFDQPLNVPLEQPSPFPFNILDHYQDYRQFYNTVFLVLGLTALVLFVAWRWWKARPRGKPEYVRDETLYADPEDELYAVDEQGPHGESRGREGSQEGRSEPVRFQLN